MIQIDTFVNDVHTMFSSGSLLTSTAEKTGKLCLDVSKMHDIFGLFQNLINKQKKFRGKQLCDIPAMTSDDWENIIR